MLRNIEFPEVLSLAEVNTDHVKWARRRSHCVEMGCVWDQKFELNIIQHEIEHHQQPWNRGSKPGFVFKLKEDAPGDTRFTTNRDEIPAGAIVFNDIPRERWADELGTKDIDVQKTWFYPVEKGVYVTDLNFDHFIRTWSSDEVYENWNWSDDNDPLGVMGNGTYGVADNLEQIKRFYPERFEVKDRDFCLSLVIMRRHEQSPSGGWRWHKWGKYIGTENPQCEYLYDEPGIKRAVCFHFHELKRKNGVH